MTEDQILMSLVSVGSSAVVGIGSSYLTFRLQLASFMAMDVEREKHWTKWRDGITDDVDTLKRAAGLPGLAVLTEKVGQIERHTEELRHWKHSVDPFIERKIT